MIFDEIFPGSPFPIPHLPFSIPIAVHSVAVRSLPLSLHLCSFLFVCLLWLFLSLIKHTNILP